MFWEISSGERLLLLLGKKDALLLATIVSALVCSCSCLCCRCSLGCCFCCDWLASPLRSACGGSRARDFHRLFGCGHSAAHRSLLLPLPHPLPLSSASPAAPSAGHPARTSASNAPTTLAPVAFLVVRRAVSRGNLHAKPSNGRGSGAFPSGTLAQLNWLYDLPLKISL